MKATFLIAASMMIGTAAFAQDTTAAPAPAPTDMSATPAPAAAPADVATTASPPASTVAPTPPADTSNYPPCSRTVHDRCVQTHELARRHR